MCHGSSSRQVTRQRSSVPPPVCVSGTNGDLDLPWSTQAAETLGSARLPVGIDNCQPRHPVCMQASIWSPSAWGDSLLPLQGWTVWPPSWEGG